MVEKLGRHAALLQAALELRGEDSALTRIRCAEIDQRNGKQRVQFTFHSHCGPRGVAR
jgi:hypothetical protein